MRASILIRHKPVVVFEVFIAGVVGRVNVNNIDRAAVGVLKHLEDVVVIAFYQ